MNKIDFNIIDDSSELNSILATIIYIYMHVWYVYIFYFYKCKWCGKKCARVPVYVFMYRLVCWTSPIVFQRYWAPWKPRHIALCDIFHCGGVKSASHTAVCAQYHSDSIHTRMRTYNWENKTTKKKSRVIHQLIVESSIQNMYNK